MFLDSSLLVNQKKLEGKEKDITCPICQGIVNDLIFVKNVRIIFAIIV